MIKRALIILLALGLMACHDAQTSKIETQSILAVSPSTFTKTLYFSGVVQPLSKMPIVAPIEGTVSQVFHHYGYPVKKEAPLCSIHSEKQRDHYEEALTSYLKAKQALNASEGKQKSDQRLFKQGLISQDEHKRTQTDYQLNRLSFLQAKSKFETLVKQYHLTQLSHLSLDNFDEINHALALKDQLHDIPIVSPIDGIALFSREVKGTLGTHVQAGDVLLYVGDMSGITIPIQANEMNINQLHIEGEAIVTTMGLSPITLQGKLTSIDHQATNNDQVPIFSAFVQVPHLSLAQQKMIHVGMSVKVSIPLNYHDQIVIPLKALSRHGTQSVVHVMDLRTHHIRTVHVETGETTDDSIIITSGLKEGDHLVINH